MRREFLKRRDKRSGTKAQETRKKTAKDLDSKRVSTRFLPQFLDDTGRSWGQIVEQEGAAGFDRLAAKCNAANNGHHAVDLTMPVPKRALNVLYLRRMTTLRAIHTNLIRRNGDGRGETLAANYYKESYHQQH